MEYLIAGIAGLVVALVYGLTHQQQQKKEELPTLPSTHRIRPIIIWKSWKKHR